MKKIAILTVLGFMPLAGAFAQQDTTVNRTVIVENEYNPTVMDASKINVMPKMNEPKATKKNINYATSLRQVSAWDYQVMSPVVREWESDAAYRGYLRGGYGNNGNVDVAAGYLWDISKRDRLNVSFSLDGWNTDLDDWKNEEIDFSDEKCSSRLYNTKLGLDYKHAYRKFDFMLGGNYHSQVFNYITWPFYEDLIPSAVDISNKQHRTLANAYMNLATTDEAMPIQFAAELGMRYMDMKYDVHPIGKETETNLYLKGDVWKQLNETHRFGAGVRLDNYSYSSDDMDGATALGLNPYYAIRNDRWNIRIGAHVDWWGGEDDKVYLSPDVHVEHRFLESYVLYAKAGGGREVSSLYELSDITPFWNGGRYFPTYVTLDAALGLKASPADGWWLHVGGGYQIRENDICMDLGGGSYPVFYTYNWGGDTKVLYGTVELRYDYKNLVDFSLVGTYYDWQWENSAGLVGGDFTEDALSLKPELEINGEVGVKVMENLRVNAGYEYIKRNESIYEPVSNLYAGADYAFMKNLNIFGKVNNLLNKHYLRPDAYPAQGLNFLAGLSFQF